MGKNAGVDSMRGHGVIRPPAKSVGFDQGCRKYYCHRCHEYKPASHFDRADVIEREKNTWKKLYCTIEPRHETLYTGPSAKAAKAATTNGSGKKGRKR